jgi:hypothetical protein
MGRVWFRVWFQGVGMRCETEGWACQAGVSGCRTKYLSCIVTSPCTRLLIVIECLRLTHSAADVWDLGKQVLLHAVGPAVTLPCQGVFCAMLCPAGREADVITPGTRAGAAAAHAGCCAAACWRPALPPQPDTPGVLPA